MLSPPPPAVKAGSNHFGQVKGPPLPPQWESVSLVPVLQAGQILAGDQVGLFKVDAAVHAWLLVGNTAWLQQLINNAFQYSILPPRLYL